MQNTSTDPTNPQNFPVTTAEQLSAPTSTTTTTTTAPPLSNSERAQNFSFASNYQLTTTSRSGPTNNKFNGSLAAGGGDSSHFRPLYSFTVLNNDGLSSASSLTYTGKPNAIVRPIRRPEQPPAFSRPPPPPQQQQQQPQQQQGRDDDTSDPQSQQHEDSSASVTQPTRSKHDVRNFVEELSRKLRYLHHDDYQQQEAWIKSRYSPRNGSQQETFDKRPLFYTTVPTGIFLPPAKEPPLPYFLQQRVYSYSSHPVVLSSNGYNSSSNGKGSYSFSKDKLRSNTAPIASTINVNDKEFGSPLNIVRGYSQSLAGGVHLTKQQFQQQIRQHRAKREVEPYRNIMHDRRVVRGTNFATINVNEVKDPQVLAAERRRKRLQLLKIQQRKPRNVLGAPPPIPGRKHEIIQTEKYLEELVARPLECTRDTQTDLFLERPPIPPYLPAKTGVDAGTEILDGELFHFEAEAQPIIEVLVDSCIEQSMLEVAHEQELEELRSKQREFLAQREIELAELRRLEAEEMRLQAEKQRRIKQDAIAQELDLEMQKGVTAAKLLQGHIASLLPDVLDNLEPATDVAKKEILIKSMTPWLSQQVAEEVGNIVDSREILSVIIYEIIKQRAEIYAGYKDEEPCKDVLPTIGEDEEGGLEEMGSDENNPYCTCDSTDNENQPVCPPPGEDDC